MKKLITAMLVGLSIAISTGVGISAAQPAASQEAAQAHQTTGVVKSIDADKGRITLAHDEVPSIGWPGMTMAFAVEDKALLEKVTPGENVTFSFVEGDGGMYVITEISKR